MFLRGGTQRVRNMKYIMAKNVSVTHRKTLTTHRHFAKGQWGNVLILVSLTFFFSPLPRWYSKLTQGQKNKSNGRSEEGLVPRATVLKSAPF